MKLLTYRTDDGLSLGVLTADGVLDITAAQATLDPKGDPLTHHSLFGTGTEQLARLADLVRRAEGNAALFQQEDGLEIGPCVPNPGKIICVGLNYRAHAAELGMAEPETPVLFSKLNNVIAGPYEAVPLPPGAHKYDYEAELVVVIGRRTKQVSPHEALGAVLGYCIGNDMTARDLQFRSSQWLLGKTLDKFFPIGPYVVTADEIPNPQALQVQLWVDGELRQNSNTSDMIFSVAEVISYISQFVTLEPGDVIATGTPQGVISGMKEQVWLKAGDEVTVQVEGLGTMRNQMA